MRQSRCAPRPGNSRRPHECKKRMTRGIAQCQRKRAASRGPAFTRNSLIQRSGSRLARLSHSDGLVLADYVPPELGRCSRIRARAFHECIEGLPKKGTGQICAQHPPGRSGKLGPSPFSPTRPIVKCSSECGASALQRRCPTRHPHSRQPSTVRVSAGVPNHGLLFLPPASFNRSSRSLPSPSCRHDLAPPKRAPRILGGLLHEPGHVG